MNCDNCYEPIRPTEARDGIEMHDGKYEFGYVHDGGNPFCDITCVATPAATRLTDADRRNVARARALAATATTDEMRAVAGSTPGASYEMVTAEALGVAKYLLAELAPLVLRLGGPVPDEEDNHG